MVAVDSETMGRGSDELGKLLMKSFLFAVSQLPRLPRTVLFYNGGAKLTVEGSESLEDLRNMEAQGVEILTCGTCLNFYGLSEKLAVGGVTNMYVIAEKMLNAGNVSSRDLPRQRRHHPAKSRPAWGKPWLDALEHAGNPGRGRMSRPFTRPVSSTTPVRHLQHFSMQKARTALLSRPT